GCFSGRNFQRSLPGKKIRHPFVSHHVTCTAEHAPIYAKRRKAKRLTVVRQAVEKGIRRTVISLSGITKNARDRREHDKAIQFHFEGSLVQEPCAVRLWPEDSSHALGRERRERGIVDYHREMKETAQRLRTRLDLCKKPPHVIRRADIRRHDPHFHTALLQVLNKF